MRAVLALANPAGYADRLECGGRADVEIAGIGEFAGMGDFAAERIGIAAHGAAKAAGAFFGRPSEAQIAVAVRGLGELPDDPVVLLEGAMDIP